MLQWSPPNAEDVKDMSTENLRDLLSKTRLDFDRYKQEMRASLKKPKGAKNLETLNTLITSNDEEDIEKIVDILVKDKSKLGGLVTPELIISITSSDLLIKIGEDLIAMSVAKKKQEHITAQKKKKKTAFKQINMRDGDDDDF